MLLETVIWPSHAVSVAVDLTNGSRQIINIPPHFGSGKNWGVYVEFGNFVTSGRTGGTSAYTSWDKCGVALPYIPITIDSTMDKFDVFGKPLGLLDVLELENIDLSANGNVIYKTLRLEIPDIVPIAMGSNFTLNFIDITTNSPIRLSGGIGNQILSVGSGVNIATYNVSCGIISFKFVEFNE